MSTDRTSRLRAAAAVVGLFAVLAPACTKDHGLASGLHSFAVRIVAPACTSDAMCGAAGRCTDGACVCGNGAACPDGSFCSARLVCEPHSSPAERLPYVSGASCTGSGSCPAGERCERFCSKLGNPCLTDLDCTGADEMCQGVCSRAFVVDVKALGRDCPAPNGDAFSACPAWPYTGWVHVGAAPGMVPPSQAYHHMTDGRLTGLPVYLARAAGRTNIWIEVDGYVRRAVDYGQCNDNLDNDGNGVIDLADPGCRDATDDCEGCEWNRAVDDRSPLGAAGVSSDLWFEPPSVRHIQFTDSLIFSPLEGADVFVDVGDMIVTNVTSTGLYLTDVRFQQDPIVAEHPTGHWSLPELVRYAGDVGFYNSIFLYTWSTPPEVYQGDVLCWFSGGVVEYMGNTQVKFPGYQTYYAHLEDCDALRARFDLPDDAGRIDVLAKLGLLLEEPDPEGGDPSYKLDLDRLTVDVTGLLVPEVEQRTDVEGVAHWVMRTDFKDQLDANALALEPLESALVRVRDVDVSTRFIDCDANASGEVEANTDEDVCRDRCQEDPLCTDLRSYARYNQWSGLFAGAKKMYVNQEMLKENIPLRLQAVGLPDQDGRCTLDRVWVGDTRFWQYTCPPRRYESVRGNLRQIYLCTREIDELGCSLQLVSLTPTGDDDVVLTGAEEN